MQVKLTTLIALATIAAATADYDPIATYKPRSDVSEHNSLDLDMRAIEEALALHTDEGFRNASIIYSNGGYSLDKSEPIRSYRGFSRQAQDKMWDNCPGCPYKDYSYFYNYYGQHAYGDHIVTAALEGKATKLDRGNFDMSGASPIAREEVAKKGIVGLNNFMYVIREFEDALDDCEANCINCNDGSVHAWDEGVAFYTGSLEGTDGSGDGHLLYSLAEKRCENFRTCSVTGDKQAGTSKINHELFQLFSLGQYQILTGDCSAARSTTKRITELMYVPYIQGSLRYAYKMQYLQGGEKEQAEGAIFSAAVVPKIYSYNKESADIIHHNLKIGARNVDFAAVKMAFEKVYPHLGVSCADVGGLFGEVGDYYPGAAPCVDATVVSAQSSSGAKVGAAVGLVSGSLVVLLIGFIIFIRGREKAGQPYFADMEGKQLERA